MHKPRWRSITASRSATSFRASPPPSTSPTASTSPPLATGFAVDDLLLSATTPSSASRRLQRPAKRISYMNVGIYPFTLRLPHRLRFLPRPLPHLRSRANSLVQTRTLSILILPILMQSPSASSARRPRSQVYGNRARDWWAQPAVLAPNIRTSAQLLPASQGSAEGDRRASGDLLHADGQVRDGRERGHLRRPVHREVVVADDPADRDNDGEPDRAGVRVREDGVQHGAGLEQAAGERVLQLLGARALVPVRQRADG
ncbi:uncharacterized protein A4U43_C05F31100 [Asparagus officinalis]|uniref:Uncharacterized protein n=1 Tax=Asparagus officinalis TaxID=4686 RepID=A0A5P1F0C5_ASPOF|nr:uncharacterized protein A4U43_C05F31100 [Asparagus officinalis]